jgi:two-component system, NtrC family, response regulator GlrR
LFYRVSVVNLSLPPLAERREDIPVLAQHFARGLAQRHGKSVAGFAPGVVELFAQAAWPGNVRQLQNTVEQCVVLCTGTLIDASLARRALASQSPDVQPLEEARREFEREYLVQLLKLTCGNAAEAARLAHRNRTDFYALLTRHQLQAAAFKAS